jgi:HD superfamily phosphodiesterase
VEFARRIDTAPIDTYLRQASFKFRAGHSRRRCDNRPGVMAEGIAAAHVNSARDPSWPDQNPLPALVTTERIGRHGAADLSDALWMQAKSDLMVQPQGGPADTVVWEHSLRVAQTADFIATLSELADSGVDRAAVFAAGLYHDAGWVVQVREGVIAARELLLRPTTDIQRELAADWLEQRAAKLLPPGSLQRAVRAVRQCNDRQADLIEGRILCDADNLDQIGPQSLDIMVRKLLSEGRTMADLVAAWDRQEEYHYWQARIKECFHFAAVRELAQRRWESMRRLMVELRAGVLLEDLGANGAGHKGNGKRRVAEQVVE